MGSKPLRISGSCTSNYFGFTKFLEGFGVAVGQHLSSRCGRCKAGNCSRYPRVNHRKTIGKP